jgi:hypothetical protein
MRLATLALALGSLSLLLTCGPADAVAAAGRFPPGGPGTPVAYDIDVKNPTRLPGKLAVLDRADIDRDEWGYKSWLARVRKSYRVGPKVGPT